MAPQNLREVVRDLRNQVVQEEAAFAPPSAGDNLQPSLKSIRNLRLAHESMYELRNAVGKLPPSPPTWRARIGGVLVGVVQRMLFWYTPQVQRFNNAGTAAMEAACTAFETQLEALRRAFLEIDDLRLELRMPASPAAPSAMSAAHPAALDAFEFEFRRQSAGPLERTHSRLQSHLDTILGSLPGPPEGTWVDLGCGTGEWCALVQAAGHAVRGVEPNARAAEHCRRAGIPVSQQDCLDFLSASPDCSLALIASFHELERHPFPYVFESIRHAARVLQPGGFLLIEASNPANILESTDRFWRDPANSRLLPQAALESLLDYCGFEIVSRRFLTAGPPEDHLPWTELDLVQKLDHYFHGPSDYALIARPRPHAPPVDLQAR